MILLPRVQLSFFFSHPKQNARSSLDHRFRCSILMACTQKPDTNEVMSKGRELADDFERVLTNLSIKCEHFSVLRVWCIFFFSRSQETGKTTFDDFNFLRKLRYVSNNLLERFDNRKVGREFWKIDSAWLEIFLIQLLQF